MESETYYSVEITLPTEDQLISLPASALKDIATKNGLKTYGTKSSII